MGSLIYKVIISVSLVILESSIGYAAEPVLVTYPMSHEQKECSATGSHSDSESQSVSSGRSSESCQLPSDLEAIEKRFRAVKSVVDSLSVPVQSLGCYFPWLYSRRQKAREEELNQSVYKKFIALIRSNASQFIDATDQSIYGLILEIEKKKGDKREHFPFDFTMMNKDGSIGEIHVKKQGATVFLVLRELGQGSFKVAREVLDYDNLIHSAEIASKYEDLSRLSPYNQKKFLETFKMESRVLKEIMALPENKRQGFVQTFSFAPDVLLQEIYDSDALGYLEKKALTMSPAEEFSILADLSTAVAQLHEMGWVHSDLKLDNVFIKARQEKKVKVGLGDFGLSYKPDELFQQNQPCVGTPHYFSPEMIARCLIYNDSKWIGHDHLEVKSNAQKADVYALATIALEVHENRSPEWVSHCTNDEEWMNRVIRIRGQAEKWFKCLNSEVFNYQLEQAQSTKYDPFSLLISRGIETDPKYRIDSQTFRNGMQHLQERSLVQEYSGNGASFKRLGSLYPELEENRGLTREQLTEKLKSLPKTSVLLSPESTGERKFFLRISYFDQSGRFSSKVLRGLDPLDEKAVQGEIQFLKDMGIIGSIKN